ncbi:MAG: hypothetical protein H0X27_03615 [Caulobacteraceae bacterium]|nr:hypothetical protein [Caulobacteraceae bacterium]
MKTKGILAAVITLSAHGAMAAQPVSEQDSLGNDATDTTLHAVRTAPSPATSTNASTIVNVGNISTFQNLLPANSARKGCTIQNPPDATETLYVNVAEVTTSATPAHSYQLTPGGVFSCIQGGIVITDRINVSAATTGHAFVSTSQP